MDYFSFILKMFLHVYFLRIHGYLEYSGEVMTEVHAFQIVHK